METQQILNLFDDILNQKYNSFSNAVEDILIPLSVLIDMRLDEHIGFYDEDQPKRKNIRKSRSFDEILKETPQDIIPLYENRFYFSFNDLDFSSNLIHGSSYLIQLENFLTRLGKEPETLNKIVTWLLQYNFNIPEELNEFSNIYETLIQKTTLASKYSREFTTPGKITNMVVDIANPKPGESVYDPCFGAGGFLAEAAKRVMDKCKSLPPIDQYRKEKISSIFGNEINYNSFLLSKVRLKLLGIKNAVLNLGDSFKNQLTHIEFRRGFDCVIADPPFGSHIKFPLEKNFQIRTKSSELLFLQHIMNTLKPGGRAVMIVRDSTLFRKGQEQAVRKKLINEFRIDGIVPLPSSSFSYTTNLHASLLCFSKLEPQSSVWFVSQDFAKNAFDDKIGNEVHRQLIAESIQFKRGDIQSTPNLDNTIKELEVEQKSKSEEITTDELIEFSTYAYFRFALKNISDLEKSQALRESSLNLIQFEFRLKYVTAWHTPINQLLDRNYELLAKISGDEQLSYFLNKINEVDKNIEICHLIDHAEIISGIKYDRNILIDKNSINFGEGKTPLIRVGDILQKSIRHPSKFISKKGLKNEKLKENDILLTRAGTVGKVGIVSEQNVDMVPADSILIIRLKNDVILPQYLIKILSSETYQDWLNGHSSGSIIKNFSLKSIKSLKIPIPYVGIQEKISQYLPLNASFSDIIYFFTSDVTSINIVNEIMSHRTVYRLIKELDKLDDSEIRRALNDLIRLLKPWRNKNAHQVIKNKEILEMLEILIEVSERVEKIFNFKSSISRFAMLESFRTSDKHFFLTTQNAPIDLSDVISAATLDRFRSLIDAITSIIEKQRLSLLNDIKFDSSINPAIIPLSEKSKMLIILENKSLLPLTDFAIYDKKNKMLKTSVTVDINETISFPIEVIPEKLGRYDIDFKWRAKRLDGEDISDKFNLSYEVISGEESNSQNDLGQSPFVIGPSIDSFNRPEMFFGRQDIINKIKRTLRISGSSTVFLLQGNRRVGKSSILKRLLLPSILPGWIPVYCTFQGIQGHSELAGLSTNELFYNINRELIIASHNYGISFDLPFLGKIHERIKSRDLKSSLLNILKPHFQNDNSFDLTVLIFENIINNLKDENILLMLDEFDKIQEGIDNKITSPQVPENIRYLFHSFDELSGILTGSRKLKRLREEYWSALFGFGITLDIHALDEKAARELVVMPVKGKLVYSESSLERSIKFCANQPFLIQSLCHQIFENCYENKKNTVSIAMVENAADEIVKENGHFDTLWKLIPSDTCKFILCLIDNLSDGSDRVTFDLLYEKMEQNGILYNRRSDLGDDIETLIELEMIEKFKSDLADYYGIEVPLFSRWLRNSNIIDYSILKERSKLEQEVKLNV